MMKIINWIEFRVPIGSFFKNLGKYPVPNNLNFLWNMGSIAALAFFLQIISGLVIALDYIAITSEANQTIHMIIKNDVSNFFRNLHIISATGFFAATYIHIAKNIYYGSFKYPRELLWMTGVFAYLLMLIIAFTGKVLPYGQVSYWSIVITTKIFDSIPYVGPYISDFLKGSQGIGQKLLSRFYLFHITLPFFLIFVIIIHIIALKIHGSNNPTGLSVKKNSISS